MLINRSDRLLYPALRRMNISFFPVSRITAGFLVMSGAIAIAAGLQSRTCLTLNVICVNLLTSKRSRLCITTQFGKN